VKSIVVYQSRHGNTEKIARAIAAGLERSGRVEVYTTGDAPAMISEDVALLVVGGPTEAHRMTEPMTEYLDRLGGVSTQLVATFDTRMRWPRFVSGSAAQGIAGRLRVAGANDVAEPMSFFVHGTDPTLEPGELERAELWGASLVEKLAREESLPRSREPRVSRD
jgi:flavodoxin